MNIRSCLYILAISIIIGGCKNHFDQNKSVAEKAIPSRSETRIIPDSLQTIEINGELLHYLEKGKGEALIFLHGSISDYRVWSGYFGDYAKEFHTLVYSRRYAWPNRQVYDSLADYSVRIHADDLYTFIQKMNLEKVHLVGHSYGAFTALTFAVDHPDMVRSMVLGEPPALFLANNSETIKKDLERFKQNHFRPAAKAFRAGNREKGLELFVGGANDNPSFKISEVSKSQLTGWMDNILELKGNALSEPNLSLDQPTIAELDMPVLLFVGDQSPRWLTSLSIELHKLLPNSSLDTLTNSRHGLYFQQPEQVKKVMRKFYAAQ